MYHEPIPEVKAGAIVGAMPEVKAGAIAEVTAGVVVRVTFEAILLVDNQGPLLGLNPEGRVTFWEPAVELNPWGLRRITHWNLPF